jgi:hypothetical protein
MKRFLFILSFAAVVVSCKKENSNEFFPYPNNEQNDTTWYTSIPSQARVRQLDSVFKLPAKIDSVDVATGGVVNFNDSIVAVFPPAFCAGGSVPVSGKVAVEITLLKQKGDMIRMDIPTMSYDKLLVTGGSLKIRVTYNNQELQLAPGKTVYMKIFTKMSNEHPTNDMKVFYGKEDAYPVTASQQFTWLPSTDTGSLNRAFLVTGQQGTAMTGYQFQITRFGWVNCDYFSDTSQPRTKAVVVLPLNFTNANTNVYAVFKTPDIVAQLKGDPGSKTFNINNIYTGKVVTFVSLSFISGKLYLASQELTVTANMNVHLNPVEMPKAQIESFLNSL